MRWLCGGVCLCGCVYPCPPRNVSVCASVPKQVTLICCVYDCVAGSGTTVTPEVLEHAERLKFIGRAGTGVNNIDIPAATSRCGTFLAFVQCGLVFPLFAYVNTPKTRRHLCMAVVGALVLVQCRGVVVMNTPGGNTTSAVELTISLMFALARHIPQAATLLKVRCGPVPPFACRHLRSALLDFTLFRRSTAPWGPARAFVSPTSCAGWCVGPGVFQRL